MILRFPSALLLVSLLITSCANKKNEEILSDNDNGSLADVHSFSNTNAVNTKHLHMDMVVNFDQKIIEGVARHQLINSGVDEVIFDTKGLKISKITLGQDEEERTTYAWGEESELLGKALKVKIHTSTQYVNIYYETTKACEALDWLDSSLTGSKKFPFLYSQGQAILTRSWIPLQDTPSNRITYSADVQVPKGMMAIMSADNPKEVIPSGQYHFEMKQAVPCYLIAIAAGDIRYKALSTNSGVYAEPDMVEACAREFEDLPNMIKTAERLFGPYAWDQYDVIVLPYSFPFGGMENPRLTFANPTLIAGDKSLVSVIAHELAHSWSGNLVTNSTWDDFWLNEGFTVYIENRIMEELEGKEVADMLALIEFQELHQEMQEIESGEHPEDTKLKLNLTDRNPDDGMTSVAYVKGAFFLKTLEEEFGREAFDKFLRSYFKKFAFKTITTEDFINYLKENLFKGKEVKIDINEWVYSAGVPEGCALVVSPRFKFIQALADTVAKDVSALNINGKAVERKDYITQEWLAFIRRLPRSISPKKMAVIDNILHFKKCGNAELMAEWYVLGIQVGYTDIRPDMSKFLIKVGRRKFLKPIYTELAKTKENKNWAKAVFKEAKGNYHFVSRNTIEEILGLQSKVTSKKV
jgi:leukotriene-A4 hydrolase